MNFVRGFKAETVDELANKINQYAQTKNLEIVQVSYDYAYNKVNGSRALVVFTKIQTN